MTLQADFYFDYGSPTSYLASVQLPGIVERTGVEIHYAEAHLRDLGGRD